VSREEDARITANLQARRRGGSEAAGAGRSRRGE
jgi:hypothetical protein